MSALKLQNVTKKIGTKTIIHQLDLTVNAGEVYGFLGPNGSGKTTTIRMMVGLIKPTNGTISIGGYDIRSERAKALAQIGTIVENPELYSYLTGRKNLIHFARLAGISNMKARIEEVIEMVDIKEYVDDKVKTYSLGMRQRLGLAQALLGNPKLLILDEPTNGLDPEGIHDFRKLIRHLASTDIAVFISSHLLSEIELMCDRVAIIKSGKVITEQSVTSLIEQKTSGYQIQLKDTTLASSILKDQKIPYIQIDQQTLQVQLDEPRVQELIGFLVSQNIMIHSVQPIQETLEDQFLILTSDKGGVIRA
ncbi:ABC transporter ATP-binding protein [Shimazuella kribbensis]|uniref:ABC transporter ATP-binding protein n=1 Tax=Shimazuella kribbensis TaxID=139808 RepID=UPI0004253F08|nr:ABC transporter ATP-binding protein [Shimazuella kribbensis]